MMYRGTKIGEEDLTLIEGTAYTVTTRRTRAGERILEVYHTGTLKRVFVLHLDDPSLFDDRDDQEALKALIVAHSL